MFRIFTRSYVETVAAVGLAALVAVFALAALEPNPLTFMSSLSWLTTLTFILGSKFAPTAWIARTRRHPWWAYALAGIGSIAGFLADLRAGALAAAGLAALLGYTLWYSRQHRPSQIVEIGQRLPEFPLTTIDGEAVSSGVLTHQPHVILFYRGSWCPFCVAQVKAVAEQYRELEDRGVRVALISPQRATDTEQLAQRFEAPMDFYIDADGAAARVLDIVQSGGTPVLYGAGTNGDTVVPTVIITRADGTVAWVHHAEDHRVRPEPSLFLEVIDREGLAIAGHGA